VRGAWSNFFISVNHVWQWMGNLFFRGQHIEEIKKLRYAELKEWNIWHELMAKEERKSIEANNGVKK
jgi:hypothetical protein